VTNPLTTALATLLHVVDTTQNWEATADAIESICRDFGDERKADLYARLSEQLKADMPFAQKLSVIDVALQANALTFLS